MQEDETTTRLKKLTPAVLDEYINSPVALILNAWLVPTKAKYAVERDNAEEKTEVRLDRIGRILGMTERDRALSYLVEYVAHQEREKAKANQPRVEPKESPLIAALRDNLENLEK